MFLRKLRVEGQLRDSSEEISSALALTPDSNLLNYVASVKFAETKLKFPSPPNNIFTLRSLQKWRKCPRRSFTNRSFLNQLIMYVNHYSSSNLDYQPA